MGKSVQISYYPMLATKTGDRDFTIKGKPNSPNLSILDGSEITSFIATKLTIGDDNITIEHEPTTNYHRRLLAQFDGSSIPELSELNLGESLEIAVNSYIPKQSESVFRQTDDADIIVFPKKISTEPIIEGACSSKKEKLTDANIQKLQSDYDTLKDMLNSLKGAGTVNTTYQYMDPEGNMECELSDAGSQLVNTFVSPNVKKINDATTTLSYVMFIVISIILMAFVVIAIIGYVRTGITQQEPSDQVNIKYIKGLWIFFWVLIISAIVMSAIKTTQNIGLTFLCSTIFFYAALCILFRGRLSNLLCGITFGKFGCG